MASLSKRLKDFAYRFRPLPDYFGRDFKQASAFLDESRGWSRERIAEYKLQRLQALIRHAENNVPYYRELFKQHGIKSGDIKSFEDYAKIPILTKDILRKNLDRLKADNFQAYHPVRTETSGTTGNMTELYRGSYHEAFRKAAIWRFYREYGFNYRDIRLNVNYPLSFEKDAPVYLHDRLQNIYSINICYIMNRKFEPMIEAIRKIKPKMIWAHPNVLFVLAKYVADNGLDPFEVPLTITYAENLYPHTMRVLHEVFTGRFAEYYGNRENTVGGWGNGDGKFYEISEYCHVEMDNGIKVAGKSEYGSLITTSLHNYAIPLIRYDSEDIGRIMGYADLNVPYPMIELVGGRGKNFFLTREGLTSPYFLTYLEQKKFFKMKRFQLEQITIDEIVFRMVPKDNFDREQDEKLVIDYIEDALDHKFKVRVEYEDDIPFTKAGKFPMVVSNLAVAYLRKEASK